MVTKNVIDLTSFDVTNCVFRSERKVGRCLLRKIRCGKDKVCVRVDNCVFIDRVVSKTKEVSIIIRPQSPFFEFLAKLERFCSKNVEDNKLAWLNDANVQIEDALVECIKYNHSYGNVICLRLAPDQDIPEGIKSGDVVDWEFGIEGLYFRRDRFGLMWTVSNTKVVGEFDWKMNKTDVIEEDDVACPDATDVEEIRQETIDILRKEIDAANVARSTIDSRIQLLDNLLCRAGECGNDLDAIETIRSEIL